MRSLCSKKACPRGLLILSILLNYPNDKIQIMYLNVAYHLEYSKDTSSSRIKCCQLGTTTRTIVCCNVYYKFF